MTGPASYSQLVPKVRVYKSMLLTPDRVREIMSTSELKEALAQLRDTIYSQASEASTLEEAYRLLEAGYILSLRRLAEVSPPDARMVFEAFIGDYELRDVLSALQRVVIGNPGLYEYPSYYVEGSMLRRISQDPEALGSPSRFIESLAGSWMHHYANKALQLYNEAKNPLLIEWAHLEATLELYTRPLIESRAMDKSLLSKILCPIVEYKTLSGLIQAKVAELDTRIISALIRPCKPCGLNPEDLRQAYDREATPKDLASTVKDVLKYVRPEGDDLGQILHSARQSMRSALKRGARAVLSSYPFTPAIAAAISALLRLEVEDVNVVLSSIVLKLNVDEYSNLIIIDK